MMHKKSLIFILYILTFFVALTTSQPTYNQYNCSGNGYAANSTYFSNLKSVVSSISNNTNISYGFYNFSVGQSPDRVYTLALCRGDIATSDCHGCVQELATSLITQLCANKKEGIAWYEVCMFRYSDNSTIYHDLDINPRYYMHNINDVPNVTEFNAVLGNLITKLKNEAAEGTSLIKFATGEAQDSQLPTIYGLLQCTPDLSREDCATCLNTLQNDIPVCCNGKIGGIVLAPSCNLRYEVYHYFNLSSLPPALSPPTLSSSQPHQHQGNSSSKTKIAAIIVALLAVFVILLAAICIFIRRRKQQKQEEAEPDSDISTVESLVFDFSAIKAATNQFSDQNKLGQGGFGSVYKGTLHNGQEIAAKRLSKESIQGDIEFKNEALLVARLQHRNLVKLRGFCFDRTERILIYEFLPNSSLDKIIFDPIKRVDLDWDMRYKIITGVAKGLLYLHEDSRLRIIHRDLKASNVLLDEDMNAKIADFGMARLFARDETQGDTSRIVGTYGYMAPEYAMHGQFSVKSDVFSFGVLVLEIVTGQKNQCFRNGDIVEDLLSYAWKCWREGRALDLIDTTIRGGQGPIRDILKCIHIGLLCVQEDVANRPTMASVVIMLSSSSLTLAVPTEPAFFMQGNFDPEDPLFGENSTETNESTQARSLLSTSEVTMTEFEPR